MSLNRPTQDDEDPGADRRRGADVPGLVCVFSGSSPQFKPIPIGADPQIIGRGDLPGPTIDERVSREHVEVCCRRGEWTLRDLGGRNGSFFQGSKVEEVIQAGGPGVLRLGATLFLLTSDLRPYLGRDVATQGGVIIGPTLGRCLDEIRDHARAKDSLLLTGPSGSGKELAARTFHSASPQSGGPFVAVNCATIPAGLAERLLFGTKRGAYSGAAGDAVGLIESAAGGILFLDELGELDLEVQAKLLRVLESKEILPLGAARPRPVNVRFCFATHRDLRSAISEDGFRSDLYYRIASHHVTLPPLQQRLEEIPFLVDQELAQLTPRLFAHARLIEECLLRPWPGNVRELKGAIQLAVRRAASEQAPHIHIEHLAPTAGLATPARENGPRIGPAMRGPAPVLDAADQARREELVELLEKHGGNIAAVARAMKKQRVQIRRWIKRYAIDRDS